MSWGMWAPAQPGGSTAPDAPSYPLCVGDVATFSEFPPRQAPMAGQAAGRQQQERRR